MMGLWRGTPRIFKIRRKNQNSVLFDN